MSLLEQKAAGADGERIAPNRRTPACASWWYKSLTEVSPWLRLNAAKQETSHHLHHPAGLRIASPGFRINDGLAKLTLSGSAYFPALAV
jgi:hypothetical protein